MLLGNRARERGATLIDTIVSTGLIALVFVGVAGAFQLSIEVVTNNKARAGAIALSNERLEYIRSFAYEDVGTVGGIPAGAIAQTEALELNGVPYTRRTVVLYGDDPKDGTGAGDTNANPADYRSVKVEVSWIAHNGGLREITLATRVSPVGIEQAVPGGTLSLKILNAGGAPVENARVTIFNPNTNPVTNLILFSDVAGVVTVIGAPAAAGYEVSVTKAGYSTAQTYPTTAENTSPSPGHLTVSLNQTTTAAFGIDVTGTKDIYTFAPGESATWNDSFANESHIAATSSVVVFGGSLILEGAPGSYALSGTVHSNAIPAPDLIAWEELSWEDTRPAQTNILYRLYNTDGSALISNSQIPGNDTGFSAPPVDLSGVSTTTHPSLSLYATLGTADPNETPAVDSWSVSYEHGPTPLPQIAFTMQGVKTIGSGPSGILYKFSVPSVTNALGLASFENLEWDTYTLTVDVAEGYDVASSCPTQPEAFAPNDYTTTTLILVPYTTYSLLVDVRASGGDMISGATVRLTRAPYDTTIIADSCGQAFFAGLSAGSPGGGDPYSISISASGYTPYSADDVAVSGTSRRSVIMN